MQAAPTAEHQRRQAADYVEETMRRSGIDWDADQSDEYAQDCVLADGSAGALSNIVRTGAGVDDPEAVTKAVGTAWLADGLKVEYSTDEMTSGAKRYLLNGGGGAVERIQFGAATTNHHERRVEVRHRERGGPRLTARLAAGLLRHPTGPRR
ncbi:MULTISPECIES: hypothetical protein [unclassified Curtobacterium]|uniref:hypothetical protein n=1 Tax=unclassified Curtobacterium TaxID=257496 RepID=UPI0039AF6B7C